MTKKERAERERKIERFEKLILRLTHIQYSDDPESLYSKFTREYNQLREELISCR